MRGTERTFSRFGSEKDQCSLQENGACLRERVTGSEPHERENGHWIRLTERSERSERLGSCRPEERKADAPE